MLFRSRRKEILTQVGISFKVKISECEEVTTKTRPDEIVLELATIKNNDVTRQVLTNIMEYDDDELVIISADTMVFYHEHMLGKPKDVLDAKRMLEMIQNDSHDVYTGVAIARIIKNNDVNEIRKVSFYEKSKVYVAPMTEKQITEYIGTEEPMDKAGGYAIQGVFAKYIKGIRGDYYNIVGLPICRVLQEISTIL